jgi:hypothetical protein
MAEEYHGLLCSIEITTIFRKQRCAVKDLSFLIKGEAHTRLLFCSFFLLTPPPPRLSREPTQGFVDDIITISSRTLLFLFPPLPPLSLPFLLRYPLSMQPSGLLWCDAQGWVRTSYTKITLPQTDKQKQILTVLCISVYSMRAYLKNIGPADGGCHLVHSMLPKHSHSWRTRFACVDYLCDERILPGAS